MANKKHKKKISKSGIIVFIVVLVIIIAFFSYPFPSLVHAKKLENRHTKTKGYLPPTKGEAGLVWTYVLMEHPELSEGIFSGETVVYDSVRVSKCHHLAYSDSYNYIKFVFKKDGKKYTAIYKIMVLPNMLDCYDVLD